MEEVLLDEKVWKYKEEGQYTIVLAYKGSTSSYVGKVLHLKKDKVPKPPVISTEAERLLWGEAKDISSARNRKKKKYSGVRVTVTQPFLQAVNNKVLIDWLNTTTDLTSVVPRVDTNFDYGFIISDLQRPNFQSAADVDPPGSYSAIEDQPDQSSAIEDLPDQSSTATEDQPGQSSAIEDSAGTGSTCMPRCLSMKYFDLISFEIFQYFKTEKAMLDVYNLLCDIQHKNIGRPTHYFEEKGAKKKPFCFGMNIGRGQKLSDFVRERPDDFVNYYEEGGVSYSISDFYIRVIRGLIKGLIKLQETQIKADMDLDEIYIITDHQQKEKPQILFTKFFLLSEDSKKLEWGKLASVFEALDDFIWSKSPERCQLPAEEMDSFIKMLRMDKIMKNINRILHHPVLWNWRKRKDAICNVTDIIKSRQYHGLNITEILNDHTLKAFGNPDPLIVWNQYDTPYWETRIKDCRAVEAYKSNAELYLMLKEAATHEKMADTEARPEGQRLKLSRELVKLNVKEVQCWQVADCIKFMRNSFVHFLEMQREMNQKDFFPTSTKDLEMLFRQLFPRANLALAKAIARNEYKRRVTDFTHWPRYC